MKLEFGTTSTIRPIISDHSFGSFHKNLKGVDWEDSTLYINIDPIPKGNPEDVIRVAEKYFGRVIVNIPEEPQFCRALKWVLSKPTEDYFFYLQDDFTLDRNVHIDELKELLGNIVGDKKVVCANLRCYNQINDMRICLSPFLGFSWWCFMLGKTLDERYNPERQTREKSDANPHGGKNPSKYCSYHYPEKKIISDIGRQWLRLNGLKRNSDYPYKFTGWDVSS